MVKFFRHLNLIIPQIGNSLLPALIFAVAFLGYFLYGEISLLARSNLHIIFWSAIAVCFGILIYFNRRKPFFFLFTAALAYIIINWLKRNYSLDYLSTPGYINLCFFAPVNLALFYFLPDRRLLNIKNLFWLVFIFAELAAAEYLDAADLTVSFNSEADGINLNSLSVGLFVLFLLSAFIKCSLSGSIQDTTLFFGSLNLFAGFYYSSGSTALTIFFAAAAVTVAIGAAGEIKYSLGHDFLTGLPGRRAYLKDTRAFPLKYSLAVICLDNAGRLSGILGRFKTQKLIKMLAMRLTELEPENPVYRYSGSEFILIFKNDNLKQSFEKLDNIRREIAASEFMFSHKRKGIKITVSGCVSEKKRSDANATEVLVRARRTLQKTCQFTQNITSKA